MASQGKKEPDGDIGLLARQLMSKSYSRWWEHKSSERRRWLQLADNMVSLLKNRPNLPEAHEFPTWDSWYLYDTTLCVLQYLVFCESDQSTAERRFIAMVRDGRFDSYRPSFGKWCTTNCEERLALQYGDIAAKSSNVIPKRCSCPCKYNPALFTDDLIDGVRSEAKVTREAALRALCAHLCSVSSVLCLRS
jgi:hypothetical protein